MRLLAAGREQPSSEPGHRKRAAVDQIGQGTCRAPTEELIHIHTSRSRLWDGRASSR